jgi:predicted Rossmann fold flavoprotein
MYDVLILGAGAGGLMCASQLQLCKELKIGVIDVNAKVGAKLRISGGGRCNITNTQVSEKNYLGEEVFIGEVLSYFGKKDLLAFLKKNGLTPVIQKERYYFCKNSSEEILSIFAKLTQKIDFHLNENILHVSSEEGSFSVKTSKKTYKTKNLVVATGGASYKTIGASDVGLQIAKSFGLRVKEFSPVLVGLTLQKEQFWMKELSGISCKVEISVGEKKLREEMLFAHRGISGPAVLSASLYWQKGEISINFLPDMAIDVLIKNSKKNLLNTLPLPKRLAKGLLDALHVEDKACAKLSKEEREKLQNIHAYVFAPAGNFGFSKAEASRGGVCSDEFSAASMMSKKVDGLYFIGEVVDVTGELGGYNFQWAFSSAVTCADALRKEY